MDALIRALTSLSGQPFIAAIAATKVWIDA